VSEEALDSLPSPDFKPLPKRFETASQTLLKWRQSLQHVFSVVWGSRGIAVIGSYIIYRGIHRIYSGPQQWLVAI
jgi:hypothetical protein